MGSLLRSRISLWAGLGGPWGRGGESLFIWKAGLCPLSLNEESEYTPRAENVCVCVCFLINHRPLLSPNMQARRAVVAQRGKRKEKARNGFPK